MKNNNILLVIIIIVRTTVHGCELNFTVLVEEGESAQGAEFALYKKAEPDTGSHVGYLVFIIYKKIGSTIPAERYISSSCKSWQVFDISSIKDDLPVGVHKFNLLVAVFKVSDFDQDVTIMTCNEAKSLFVMDTSADIHEFQGTEASRPEPENETGADSEIDENGNEKLSKDKNINETDQDNETELEEVGASGSGEGEDLVATTTTSTPPMVEDSVKVEDFLPTLAVFVRGGPNPLLTKRSAIEQNKKDTTTPGEEQVVEDSEESSGANCRRLENKVDLPASNPNVIQPVIKDIGKCSDSTDTVECRPTAFDNLQVLLKIGNATIIEVRENCIITECTPFAKTPLSTIEDSTSSGSTSPQQEMVTEAADVNAGGSGGITAATNCSLLENKTDLSTISPYIIEPKIYDFGKCSDSTDTVECRPTGFRDLTVVLHFNGTTSIDSLQNSIITECTPYYNTPTQGL